MCDIIEGDQKLEYQSEWPYASRHYCSYNARVARLVHFKVNINTLRASILFNKLLYA